MSEIDQPIPGSYFPKNEKSDVYAKRLGGFDIYKSKRLWMALVAVEKTNMNKRTVKWFRWEMRSGDWKTDLCNMSVDYLDFDELKRKIILLKELYNIK